MWRRFTWKMRKIYGLCAWSCRVFIYIGYIQIFAIFGICAIPATVIKVPFHLMADILLVIYLIISLAAIIVLRKDILKKMRDRSIGITDSNRKFVILVVLLVMIVLCFTQPKIDDSTVSIAGTALQTDRMYQYNAYTKKEIINVNWKERLAPVEMFFSCLTFYSKVPVSVIVYVVFPIFMIPVLFCGYYSWAHYFFGENKKIMWKFMCVCAVVLSVPLFSKYMTGYDAYQNIWQGKCLLMIFILPMMTLDILEITENIEKKQRIGNIIMLFCYMIGAEVVYYPGIVFAILVIIAGIALYFVRRCMKCNHLLK